MDRVLLLVSTASYRAGAFLEAARRIGVAVVVGSDRPQALAAAHPAGHITLDFQSPGPGSRAIAEFSRRYPIAAVVAADDDGVMLAAAAAEAMGIAHASVRAVATARNKLRMREALAEAGIPSPGFACVALDQDPERVAAGLRYPCVLKPLTLSASRGVIRADDPRGFVAAFARVAALLRTAEVQAREGEGAREVLVEDFIPGAEVALEGLITRGELRTLALFDKPDPLEGPFFEETIYVTPSRLDPGAQGAASAMTARVAAAFGLDHGPVHAELRVGERGPIMLEIAPRPIGGLCSRALRFGAGVSLEELVLQHALGLDVGSLEREQPAAGVMMIPIPRAGVLREVSGEREAMEVEGIDEIRITIPVGQEVVPLPEGARYLGFIFARSPTPARVEGALREAHRRLRFDIGGAGKTATGVGRHADGARQPRRSGA